MSRTNFTDSPVVGLPVGTELCRHEILTVADIARMATGGDLDIPAFQRGFVWTDEQLLDLAESLWRAYPIGMLLLWEPQIRPAHYPALLVADGQHRIISLCALFGKTPHWCSSDKNRAHAPRSIWFDPAADTPPRFFLGDDSKPSKVTRGRLVSLPHLLSLNLDTAEGRQALRQLANDLAGSGRTTPANRIYRRLTQARAIVDRQVIAAVVRHPRDDVMEIFTRLSGHGIRFRRLLLRTALKATRALWDTSVR